ncbi:MAG TPA: hypothetical protein VLZ50_03875 [Terracidiphilus sp.]|nr:hypothetical protein [Terracidiphilus sp.]
MSKLRILLIVFSFLPMLHIAAQTAAQTQPAPPEGWTSRVNGGATIWTAPGQERDRPELMFLPPQRPQGETKEWFGNQALALAKSAGSPISISDVLEKDGVLLRVVQIEDTKHHKPSLAIYGYLTANGLSAAVLAIPEGFPVQDPRMETAKHYIRQLANQKYEIAPFAAPAGPPGGLQSSPGAVVQAPNSGGPPFVPPPHGNGDLTYHAKAILPAERDVPLKGVYLFVGYAFGATYGGVGTTMNWGQHAVQQLLLLYENGVAAKVDLRGGNLAGKYQAEGFATLDVTNPAVVSSAPFGRWSEDENAVHLQWANGSLTDLAKNGPDLEGKGERWHPYQIAEGDVLEGTFVRKMEAGLRSQWIVFKRDGTFSGEGVNVTMGGSMVNPRFPERGGGTYTVHKGSMILFFSNGFTQSIACTLDHKNSPDVQLVLLNGFPFERVR